MSDALLDQWKALPAGDTNAPDDAMALWGSLPSADDGQQTQSAVTEDDIMQAWQSLPPEAQQGLWEQAGRFAAREILKPALQGVTDIADIPAALYNLTSAGIKWGFDKDMGQAPYLSDAVGKGVDWVTDGYSEGEPGIVGQGIRGGVSIAVPGAGAGKMASMGATMGSKALSNTGKALGYMGSTKAPAIAGGAMGNIAGHALQEEGKGASLESFMGAMGADALTQAGVGMLTKRPRPFLAASGLGPKHFDVKTYEKAKAMGIDLPAVALTDSASMDMMHQMTSKMPFVGGGVKDKVAGTSKQIQDVTGRVADEIGPSAVQVKPEGLDGRVNDLYKDAYGKLTPADTSDLTHTQKAIAGLKGDLAKSKRLSDGERQVLDYVDDIAGKIKGGSATDMGQVRLTSGDAFDISQMPKDMQDQIRQALPSSGGQGAWTVEELIRTKRSLNDLMKGLYKTENKDTRMQLKKMVKAYNEDIAAFGKNNPDFMQAFTEAEKLHGKIRVREKFDDKFAKVIHDPVTEQFKYGTFNRIMADPKQKRIMVKEFGQDVVDKLSQIDHVARANAKAIARTPNPSGTAITNQIMDMAKGTIELITSGRFIHAPGYVTPLIAPWYAKRILTNPKVLEKAYQFAKNPTDTYAKQLANTLKSHTGYSTQQLGKMFKGTSIEITPDPKHPPRQLSSAEERAVDQRIKQAQAQGRTW